MGQFGIDFEVTINRFNHLPPTEDQKARMNEIRLACMKAAQVIIDQIPQCPERTLALRWLRQTQAQANEAVMFNPSPKE